MRDSSFRTTLAKASFAPGGATSALGFARGPVAGGSLRRGTRTTGYARSLTGCEEAPFKDGAGGGYSPWS